MLRTSARICIALLCCLALTAHSRASIGLVVGEPFGAFGTMMPAGHAGIYLDHLCAETPTELRPCRPGEHGVVLSRYHDLRSTNTDWMAIPTIPFFYGVDDPAATPAFVTESLESELRETYREQHLRSVAPDRFDHDGQLVPPKYGDWQEGIGAAFDRRLLVYIIDTTPEQDAAILATLNGNPNEREYTLFRNDCADFANDLLNLVLPQPLPRNPVGDLGMTSPKNLAVQLDSYGRAHPEVNLRVYEVPQIPGTLRRSRPMREAAETLVKTKRYLFTLIAIQPEAILADWVIYETKDTKVHPARDAIRIAPAQIGAFELSANHSNQRKTSLPTTGN